MNTPGCQNILQQAKEAAAFIQNLLPPEINNPKIGIICGSGLGGLAATVEAQPRVEVDYGNIPHFPKSTGMNASISIMARALLRLLVQGHAGKLVIGLFGPDEQPVIVMNGRVQYVTPHRLSYTKPTNMDGKLL